MASSITALKAAFTVQIATISDALRKAEAEYTLDVWADAMTKQAALEANDITSYSIGGRTFTRRDIAAGQQSVQQLRYNLEAFIYGTQSLVDNNQAGAGARS